MEVRLANVTLSAPAPPSPTPTKATTTAELPTIANSIKHAVRSLLPTASATGSTGSTGRSSSEQHRRVLLRDVSCVFPPGTMTLVLGQPGSGKSSLLKLISGRLQSHAALTVDGHVSYNGVSQHALRSRLPQLTSYVPQRDCHFPTLTVQETIAFAHDCSGGGSDAGGDNGTKEGSHGGHATTASGVVQRLGLAHCHDTIVGDAMIRGVSGGERKRVTLGEMDASGHASRVMSCLDEISTGLDSAATLDIATQYRALATTQQKTVVMALLQPAPEVLALFDSVLLLSGGHVMYHGPCDGAVVSYFARLGLHCPPHRDVADFLLDLGTHQQAQYESSLSHAHVPRTASEFGEIFMKSDLFHAAMDRVQAPVDGALRARGEQWLTAASVPRFHRSFCHNVRVLVQRDLRVTLRNTVGLRARLATLVISSLLLGTLFYQLDETNVQLTMGILFGAVQFLALEQSSLIPQFQAARAVFYKQRAAQMYRTSAFVVSSSIGQMPMMVTQTLLFGTVVYWLCGFVASASQFLVFELLLLLANCAFNAWFFLLAAVTPNLHAAEPFNLLSLLLFILFAGFMIPRDLIPDYFVWAYWINPMAWCLRSVVVNQYSAPEFQKCEYKGVDYCTKYGTRSMGEYALSVFNVQADPMWRWAGVAFMAGAYVLFMALSAIALETKRYDEEDSGHYSTTNTDTAAAVAATAVVVVTSDDKEDHAAAYSLVKSPRHDENTRASTAITIQPDATAGLYERHFTPVTLAFQDLWYSVPNPTDATQPPLALLRGISGFALPGTITALMGSSGAGKTTLMDVLAGRKTKSSGEIQGKIFLNGHEASDMAIRRCTAYCEQMDVHADAATFREALTFSAFLRQSSSVPSHHKLESVDECLDLLDLRPIADCIVRGSSVEQLKRLTIGVELAAQPSLLFLDEPTSGLDARAAKMIMDGVRKVADSGRTVVCTIHQPSFEVFQVFDRLLLLQRGGQTVYFGDLGERGRAVVEYFEQATGKQESDDGSSAEDGIVNPATWMLEVIGAGVGVVDSDSEQNKEKDAEGVDFAQLFLTSKLKVQLDADLDQRDGLTRPAQGVAPLSFGSKRAASSATQAVFLTRRSFRTYWRTPDYMLTRAGVYLVLALVFGLSYAGRAWDSYQGINAGVAMVYATTVFVGVIAFEAASPLANELRASFYRERQSESYNALWFFVGSSLVEIPYVFGSCLVFCGVFFPLAGFTGVTRFLLYWFHMSMHTLLQTYMGEFLGVALPDVGAAMTVGVVISTVGFNTIGFNPPASAMPSAYKWLYEIVPPQFAFSIMGALLFGQCDQPNGDELGCRVLQGDLPPQFEPGTTIQQYVQRVFLIESSEVWSNFAWLVAYIALFRVLTLLAMRFVNHQRK